MSNCKFYKKQQEVKYPGSDDWIPTGQYEKGNLIEEDSPGCGYTPPTPSGYADQYLTIWARESFELRFSGTSSTTVANTYIEYSTNISPEWRTLNSGVFRTFSPLEKVMIRGNLTPISTKGIGNFTCYGAESSGVIVEGNIMSLLYGSNFRNQVNLNGKNYAFYNLFSRGGIRNAENLILPATTLSTHCYHGMFSFTDLKYPPKVLPALTLVSYCYYEMFYYCSSLKYAPQIMAATMAPSCCYFMFGYCSSLTTPPQLPATTLADSCYLWMFKDCTSLTTAPDLPATRLERACYFVMFENCESLMSVPSLPATTLASQCYDGMFRGCISLTNFPSILPATTLEPGCYHQMFSGCHSLRTAPQLPSTTLASYCYQEMFEDCVNLTSTPPLYAATLKSLCYQRMFRGCSSLSYVKCLATDRSANNCTDGWLENVAQSGTFVKAISTTWSRGISGIPDNWTIQDSTS